LTPMNASDLLRGALRASLAVLLLWWLGATAFADNLVLTGSNGREVTFAGIREATPQGLIAQMSAEGEPITIPWETLDLGALRERQPEIHAAYEAAQGGERVALNFGIFGEGAPMQSDTAPAEASASPPAEIDATDTHTGVRQGRYPGWIDTTVGDMRFFLQMPGGTPQGILFYSVGNDGRAFRYLISHQPGQGQLGQLQAKHRLAILTYSHEYREADPTVLPDFARVEKDSGAKLLLALERIASEIGNPDLKDLPFVLYGTDRVGASFAYHFLQWRPDRVMCALISKGAFYDAEPRADSMEVPALFLEGQYSNDFEIWGAENHFRTLLDIEEVRSSNWTFATEFRTGGGFTQESEYFGFRYLDEMIPLRLPEAVAAADDESEDGDEEEESPKLRIPKLDRSKGFVGDLSEWETSRLNDPDAAMEEDKTFIPTSGIATLWKGFVDGSLEPRVPGRDQ